LYEELAAEFKQYDPVVYVAEIDGDESYNLAQQFNVSEFPTLYFYV